MYVLPALELVEQAEEDGLGRLVGGLAVAQAQEAELADGVEVAREQQLVVTGLEQSPVFDVARIVHRGQSLSRHGPILRSGWRKERRRRRLGLLAQ